MRERRIAMSLCTRLLEVLVAALALGVCGCSPKTVKVVAVVTLDGQPVEGATVKLVPEEGSTGEPASGLTGKDGSCRLQTYSPGDGVVPGEYKVSVSKTESLAAERPNTKDRDAMKKLMMAATTMPAQVKKGEGTARWPSSPSS
jgi:hypothetical protein